MTITLVYDDTVGVPPDITTLTGLDHFGPLFYRKKTLASHVFATAETVVDEIVHLRGPGDLAALKTRLAFPPPDSRYIYFPANIAPGQSFDLVSIFFQKIALSSRDLALTVGTAPRWTGIFLVGADRMREIANRDSTRIIGDVASHNFANVAAVENRGLFVDLADYTNFLEFITSHFQVRHFNDIGYDRFTVRKSSRDKEKIRREYSFYKCLPESMQVFFVQAFDFAEAGISASYKMERLNVPDVAMQWVHDAFSKDEFDRLLERLFNFLGSRVRKTVLREIAEEEHRRLYLYKVEERVQALKALPLFTRLDGLLAGATPFGGIDRLFERYASLLARLARGGRTAELSVSHGDLCFSNILYDKRTQLLKLIDPRGAASVDELFMDPYYDLAKLSHSILGGYDFINNGHFTAEIDNDLRLKLSLAGSDRGDKQAAFRAAVAAAGFRIDLVRLYEASLFISMLPLHADDPGKLVAFALTASAILEDLERR